MVAVLRAVPQSSALSILLPAFIREDGRGVTAVLPAERMHEESLSDLEGECLTLSLKFLDLLVSYCLIQWGIEAQRCFVPPSSEQTEAGHKCGQELG